jgi:hypothetical protein
MLGMLLLHAEVIVVVRSRARRRACTAADALGGKRS